MMLTKDLLKFTRREDRIYPKYLKTTDNELQQLADSLVQMFELNLGFSWKNLTEQLKLHRQAAEGIFQGFCKLLEDRCVFNEGQNLEEQRWQWLELSRRKRLDGAKDFLDFENFMQAQSGLAYQEMQDRLYADLPEHRALQSFASITGEALIHRYNAAQIQGLLLRAQEIKFFVKDPDVLQRRRLLQKLRFCRLMAEFEDDPEHALVLKISGPMSIFEQTQSYGMRLCQFFPYVLLFPAWELEARVKIGEAYYQLNVDSSKPIASHYREFTGYIPVEFQDFMNAFNDLSPLTRKSWRAEESKVHINLGQQSYSFPDLTFKHDGGLVVHVELFHRWHEVELRRRVDSLKKNSSDLLLLGMSQDLLKEVAMQELLAEGLRLGVNIFTFRQFPTVKAILSYLPSVKI